MADNPIAKYFGADITCYPSSNATDNGKLNVEFNMSRIVTRLSSKNFCIIKPSYELTLISDATTGQGFIRVGTGQSSINGMDLIMTNTIDIEPPVDPGHYYLIFKLERDGSSNVLGDYTYGVTVRYEGVSLRYTTEKPDPLTDMDVLYLGELDWDGTKISNLKEDEDKYGRIWAEDILGKFLDPKHPDITRLNLQEMIYNLPDWYFSKEGDTVYGPIIMTDGRTKNNPGVIINVDENGSHIVVKDPTVDNDKLLRYGDVNQDNKIDDKDIKLIQDFIDGKTTLTDLQQILADVNHDGVVDEKDITYIQNFLNGEGNPGDTNNIYYMLPTDKGIKQDVEDGISKTTIGTAEIYQEEVDRVLHIHNDNDICIDAQGKVKVEGTGSIELSTDDAFSPTLKLNNDKVFITDPTAPDLEWNVQVTDANTIQNTLGKAIWEYNKTTQDVKLLQNNVRYLDIVPNGVFRQDLTVTDDLFLGPLGQEETYLKQRRWQLSDNNKKEIQWTPSSMIMTNKSLSATDNSYILLKNTGDTIHTKVLDDGNIELLNNIRNTTILWKDGTATYDVTLEKIKGEKRLNLQGNLSVTDNITALGSITGNGLTTTNGVLTFQRGTNNATLTKDNNSTTLRTNGNLYVGASGTQELHAGNTVINGTFAVGGNSYANSELKIDAAGNINTSGTITGSKVYNAVYNDYAEVFRKSKFENIEPGDVVCMGLDGLVHKVQTSDDFVRVIGICSDTEGVLLGGKDIPKEEQVIVGLVGQIWVKTDNAYIRPGNIVGLVAGAKVDLLTNTKQNKFGIAMTTVREDGKVRIVYNG